ncbi:transposase [Microbacterium sp. KR10-403]
MGGSQAQLHAVGAPKAAKSRGRRVYSEAFKRDAVEKARAAKSISQVARALGVSRPTLSAWMKDAAPPPMTLIEAVQSGSRKSYLIAWRDELARKITSGVAARELAPLGKQLNDTIRELEELVARETEEAADAVSAPDEDLDPDDL